MSAANRILYAATLPCFLFFFSPSAAILTVAKNGADFSTISAAIQASQPGDVIKIMDTETYEEQVTIDSTKYPLTLTSKDPTSLTKPTIKFQDKIHVKPRTYAEALVDSTNSQFQQNGALRIIKAHNIIIDGIGVDGGDVYPYGYPGIWEQRYALQAGNAAISIYVSSDCIVRNCDITNAYFGINFTDRNLSGIFATPVEYDCDCGPYYHNFSRFGFTGNHLVERNRIHDNSWGMFFESSWDLGTTIRYNLFYENHHANDSIATLVRSLTTDESPNQPGGAFLFKDVQLSPLAIYNNTFYHNFLIFAGHWQTGYQHLVFNNIFGSPNKYWRSDTTFIIQAMELTPVLANRLYSSIFSAQVQAPQANGVKIMDSLPLLQGTGGVAPDPGTIISGAQGFPTASNVRWLEMEDAMFLSVNPVSPNFLEPNWADENVKSFIVERGWQKAGVKNTDGSWADLGAIEQAHGTPSFVGTIKPAPMPILVGGAGSAQITFALTEREGTTMTNPRIKLFRLVKLQYKRNTFGSGDKSLIISASDMTDVDIPTTPPVKVGPNSYSISANITSEFAFIEMIIEATGTDGRQFTAAVGFLPYRKLEYYFKIEVLDKTGTTALTETHIGDTVMLRINPQKITGEQFTNKVDSFQVTLHSGVGLFEPGASTDSLGFPDTLIGPTSKLVMFAKIPEGGDEHITVSGGWKNPATNTIISFLGGISIKVLPAPSSIALDKPFTSSKGICILPHEVTIKCFDLQGRRIFQKSFLSDIGLALMPRYLQNNI